MLILLPPSEGKTAPGDGASVDLVALAYPELTAMRERALAAGFDDYLSKPIDFTTFAACVGDLLP